MRVSHTLTFYESQTIRRLLTTRLNNEQPNLRKLYDKHSVVRSNNSSIISARSTLYIRFAINSPNHTAPSPKVTCAETFSAASNILPS